MEKMIVFNMDLGFYFNGIYKVWFDIYDELF